MWCMIYVICGDSHMVYRSLYRVLTSGVYILHVCVVLCIQSVVSDLKLRGVNCMLYSEHN